MKDSKFTEAYLAIINEENESFTAEAQAADTADITAQASVDSEAQVICFKTTDKNLIDAINSGFDEVVFFVKAKDEATGEDTVQEVKFGPESFEDLEVKAATEDTTCPECGEGTVEDECGDGAVTGEDSDGTVTDECGDGAITNEDSETINPSEWLEDGVCVKCGNPECDGTCKCKKCGSQNCIGDCEDGDGAVTNEDGESGGGNAEGGDI